MTKNKPGRPKKYKSDLMRMELSIPAAAKEEIELAVAKIKKKHLRVQPKKNTQWELS